MAAAKEFNVGKDTLVDFLLARGFSKDDLKPTSKLTEEMYRSLQQEFQSDKVAKLKSDQIDLPKGAVEARKRKEEEAIVFRKETRKPAEEVKEIKPEPKEEAPVAAAPVAEPPAPQPAPEAPKTPEPDHVKIEAPEIGTPKVYDKIDLSAIDSSTRPKKTAKKKAEPKAEEAPKAKAKAEPAKEAEQPVAKATEPAPEEAAPEVKEDEKAPEAPAAPADQEEAGPVISNIKAEKLEGPKILGKIELPTHTENRGHDEKRQRKRIPIQRKDAPVQRNDIFKRREGEQGGQRPGFGQQSGGGNFRRDVRPAHVRPGGQRPAFISLYQK